MLKPLWDLDPRLDPAETCRDPSSTPQRGWRTYRNPTSVPQRLRPGGPPPSRQLDCCGSEPSLSSAEVSTRRGPYRVGSADRNPTSVPQRLRRGGSRRHRNPTSVPQRLRLPVKGYRDFVNAPIGAVQLIGPSEAARPMGRFMHTGTSMPARTAVVVTQPQFRRGFDSGERAAPEGRHHHRNPTSVPQRLRR